MTGALLGSKEPVEKLLSTTTRRHRARDKACLGLLHSWGCQEHYRQQKEGRGGTKLSSTLAMAAAIVGSHGDLC